MIRRDTPAVTRVETSTAMITFTHTYKGKKKKKRDGAVTHALFFCIVTVHKREGGWIEGGDAITWWVELPLLLRVYIHTHTHTRAKARGKK